MSFHKAEKQAAFLKCGLYGQQGTGKTWTAINIAIGLAKHIESSKPIFFVDSEHGSDYHVDRVREAGLELMVDKTRAFTSLLDDVRHAEHEGHILIIDSITHFWRELMNTYLEKSKYDFLTIRDFGPIKNKWALFSDLYVNSQLHIILCGRQSNIFQDVEDDRSRWSIFRKGRSGNKEYKTIKAGTKMAAESELAYEPSLLVELERQYLEDGGRYVRLATVVKERFGVLDGKEFKDPKFEDFLPHIEKLELGARHVGYDATQHSDGLFDTQDDEVRQQTLEDIQGMLISLFPGQTKEEKKAKADILMAVYDTRSWTAIQGKPQDELQAGLEKIEFMGHEIAGLVADEEPTPADLVAWLRERWANRPPDEESEGESEPDSEEF